MRRLKSKLPTTVITVGAAQVRRQLSKRQEKQKIYYDRQTRTLSDLKIGYEKGRGSQAESCTNMSNHTGWKAVQQKEKVSA